MPERLLTADELEQLQNTAFGQMKRILEERKVPERLVVSVPAHMHQDLHFRLNVRRCEYDNAEPYLSITEATNSVGFLFSLSGELLQIVNYK